MLFSSFEPPDNENPPWPCSPRSPAAPCQPAREPSRRTREGGCRRSPRRRNRAARSRSVIARPRAVSECSASPARRGGPSVGLAGPAWRDETFPPCKPLKTKETELESRQIPRQFRGSPMQRPRPFRRTKRSRREAASILGVVSRKSAGRRTRAAKFSYPQTIEKAGNGEGIWLLPLFAPARAGVEGKAASDSSSSFLRVGRGRYEL